MKRYKYGMKHRWTSSTKFGQLKPIFMQEVTPGDTWSGSSLGIFRMAPLDVPTYTNTKIFVHYFFVPYRLIWADFEDEITGAAAATWPTITQPLLGGNWFEFGVPFDTNSQPEYNALPIRAYNAIYNSHFRPEDIAEIPEDTVAIQRVNFPTSDYFGSLKSEIQQDTEVTVDTSQPTLAVTAIRDAFNRQRLKERRSQYGERYRDMLYSDYGVTAPDSRLDRPEHLARAMGTIGISEVVATATSAGENTGEYRGHGITGIRVPFRKRHFTEHGLIMGLMYVRPRLTLKTGLDHIWLTQDKEELYIPSLATDTLTTISSREIHNDATPHTASYAYQDRYEHLRSARDVIAGGMKNSSADSWTTHVRLSSVPTLSFLQQVQSYDTIFQDTSSASMDIHSHFEHAIGKTSVIKPRNRR